MCNQRREAPRDGVSPVQTFNLLADILAVTHPDTTWVQGSADGEPYIHVGNPSGTVDYFIQKDGDVWKGVARGNAGLPLLSGPSPWAVAAAAAVAVSNMLSSAALQASEMVSDNLDMLVMFMGGCR